MYKTLLGMKDTTPDFTFEDLRELDAIEECPAIDLSALPLVDLHKAFAECPAIDYPLGEEMLAEILNRAGIDVEETDEDGERVYTEWDDAYYAACERLGIDF